MSEPITIEDQLREERDEYKKMAFQWQTAAMDAIRKFEEEQKDFDTLAKVLAELKEIHAETVKARDYASAKWKETLDALVERGKLQDRAAELLRFPKDGITLREGWYERRDAWLKDAGAE